MYANHGRTGKYDHKTEGVNSRLDGIQAAILNVKLPHLREWTEKRRMNSNRYNNYLNGLDGIATPKEIPNVQAVYHLYVIRVKGASRNRLQEYMNTKGISTGIHYPIALPNLSVYGYMGQKENDFQEATKASQEILSLPIFPELQEENIKYISGAIQEWLGNDGR